MKVRAARLPARRYDAVLFDLDGTLADSAGDLADAVDATLRQLGRAPAGEARVRGLIGHGARALMQGVLGESTPLDAPMALFSDHYLSAIGRRSRLFPGATAMLRSLATQGVALALLTNKEERYAWPLLHALGIGDCFDVAVFGDTLRARKPDPAPVRHALQQLQVEAPRALLVGDSAIDVAAARNAGIAVWLVSHGYDAAADAAMTPDRRLDTLDEVLDVLG